MCVLLAVALEIDSSNKVRFWRTSSSPNCWAVVEPVPGDGTLKSIASYVVAGQTGIFKFTSGSSFGPAYIDVHGKVWTK